MLQCPCLDCIAAIRSCARRGDASVQSCQGPEVRTSRASLLPCRLLRLGWKLCTAWPEPRPYLSRGRGNNLTAVITGASVVALDDYAVAARAQQGGQLAGLRFLCCGSVGDTRTEPSWSGTGRARWQTICLAKDSWGTAAGWRANHFRRHDEGCGGARLQLTVQAPWRALTAAQPGCERACRFLVEHVCVISVTIVQGRSVTPAARLPVVAEVRRCRAPTVHTSTPQRAN